MGKVVSMPNNTNRHLTLGQRALKSQNYASAVAHLEKAFKQAPAFEIARLLVSAYNGLSQPQEAVGYLSEFMEDFLAHPEDTATLYDTLIALPDYRFAWAVLHHVQPDQQHSVKARIEAAEAADMAKHQAEITELARQLRHLGGFEPHQQEELLKNLGRLPRTALISAARANLADPDVHPAVRISLLDALTAVDDDQPVMVAGYQQSGEVVPNALPGVLGDHTLLAVLDQIQRQIGLGDPELMRATVEVLRFELGYLYPFIDAVIPDPAHFAASYFHKEAASVTKAEQALFNWMQQQTAKLMDMA
ncbi:hypothetical protein ACFQ5J_03520 [Lacticaseibacillus baoqingensis]|uniref:Tetratricopeptide repeat protein n=1 Tax=Lacticaseibacillus baoqingensis TaxID=2486013 RepID=A0ABW4E6X5_9LACO|nr:hypothetical protein [Lacticaseibacillus baoqingensis]